MIIDEISMVRADIIDFIDKILRVYSQNMREPFGGKQILLVGDVFQLEPVIKNDEREIINRFYPTPYFFFGTGLSGNGAGIHRTDKKYTASRTKFLLTYWIISGPILPEQPTCNY